MQTYYDEHGITIYNGDCREVLPCIEEGSIDCCVTSPPYWGLRDYGVAGQIGLEPSPKTYVDSLIETFRNVRRALKPQGTLWLNLGDCYHNGDKGGYAKDRVTAADSLQRSNLGANFIGAPNRQPQDGLKPKDLVGIPWMVAFALRDDGWYLRQWAPWVKRGAMPESVTDRPSCAAETIFLLSKSKRYFYDWQAARESCASGPSDIKKMREGKARLGGKSIGHENALCKASARTRVGTKRSVGSPDGRNRRNADWWFESVGMLIDDRGEMLGFDVNSRGYSGAHFAVFPTRLIEPCIRAGCPDGGVVLDPFFGSGTTGIVARGQCVRCIGIEMNTKYCAMAANRLRQDMLVRDRPAAAAK